MVFFNVKINQLKLQKYVYDREISLFLLELNNYLKLLLII